MSTSDEVVAEAPHPRARRVRTVDFRRPTKFHPEQQRRLKAAHETFCRTATARLGGELRLAVDLELLGMTQLTWFDAHAAIPAGSLGAVLLAQPIGTSMLITAELSLVLALIEVMTGGRAADMIETPPASRRLTDCDMALARHFFEILAEHLSTAWQDLTEIRLSVTDVDIAADLSELATTSEPTLSFVIEVRLGHRSATIGVLLPHRSIQPVESRIGLRDRLGGRGAAGEEARMQRALGRVDLELRAEIGALEMPAAELLALRPGDLIELPGSVQRGITLRAGDTVVGHARPGRQGASRAVQIISRGEASR